MGFKDRHLMSRSRQKPPIDRAVGGDPTFLLTDHMRGSLGCLCKAHPPNPLRAVFGKAWIWGWGLKYGAALEVQEFSYPSPAVPSPYPTSWRAVPAFLSKLRSLPTSREHWRDQYYIPVTVRVEAVPRAGWQSPWSPTMPTIIWRSGLLRRSSSFLKRTI